jgi:hypothetical protein
MGTQQEDNLSAPAYLPSAPSALPAEPVVDLAGLQPVETIRRRWPMLLGALLSAAMVFALARELLDDGLVGLDRAAPDSPWFYVTFALLYLSAPLGDLLIYRYLWRVPWLGGFAALNKKRIANDVVLGYSGEAYFYAWARSRGAMVAAPFGAVKDVSILSGMVGNGATLLLCVVALPLGYRLIPAAYVSPIVASAAVTLLVPAALLLFSRRIFSLPRHDLWVIFGLHAVRLLASTLLLALAWHFAMPSVAVGMWLILSAGRLLVSRLPLLPNKDLVFASAAILIVGQDQVLTSMIAFTTALQLLLHAGVVVGFSMLSAVEARR